MGFDANQSDTVLGPIALRISDIHRAVQFYQEVLGLELRRRESHAASLGAGGSELLVLQEERSASQPPPYSTGLYHLAILLPSRQELARALRRLAQSGWPIQGFADHGVSEAIYLSDPDGNGIEIYRDYPRTEWPQQEGRLHMGTDPLDVDGVLAELENTPAGALNGVHPDTRLGHVHLRVADIAEAENFYCDLLGFDLMQRFGPSARFVSVGGYHHHIGFNSWNSAGAPPAPAGVLGMIYFTIRLPDAGELERIAGRLRKARRTLEETSEGMRVYDPSRNGILLTT